MKSCKTLTFVCLAFLLLISGNLFAQEAINVNGTVTDEAGLPVIGANIQLMGSNGTGTITDIDGHFGLNNVPFNASLEISYIGYVTTTVKVTGSTLNIVLKEDTELLDEVVVVGYGVQRKSDLTGAVTARHSARSEYFSNRHRCRRLFFKHAYSWRTLHYRQQQTPHHFGWHSLRWPMV